LFLGDVFRQAKHKDPVTGVSISGGLNPHRVNPIEGGLIRRKREETEHIEELTKVIARTTVKVHEVFNVH